mmetsp:Transcript_17576/g.25182  ORF Transcript_17576/g.25182 Transcript_17576/m.25182 type:complete len:204 (+) Transcript_17576:754-1365(+)
MTTLFDSCSWLEQGISFTTSKIIIGASHGTLFETLGTNNVKELLQTQGGGALYLHNEAVVVEKLVFYGSPWSPLGTTGNNAFQRNCHAKDEVTLAQKQLATQEAKDKQKEYYNRIDVLLTHAGGRNTAWNKLIYDENEILLEGTPKYWIHGHWHDGHGDCTTILDSRRRRGRKCVSVNVASNDMIYRPVNPPVVLDVPFCDRT